MKDSKIFKSSDPLGKNLSTDELAMKNMRVELMNIFPKNEFKIQPLTSKIGTYVSIIWLKGPTNNEVNDIVKKYQLGDFTGASGYEKKSDLTFNDSYGGVRFILCSKVEDEVEFELIKDIQDNGGREPQQLLDDARKSVERINNLLKAILGSKEEHDDSGMPGVTKSDEFFTNNQKDEDDGNPYIQKDDICDLSIELSKTQDVSDFLKNLE
jgi:hypothetical protein